MPATAQTIRRNGSSVKERIAKAGVRMGDLAKTARISRPSLSNHVVGRRRNRLVQLAIWDAYRRLTGRHVSLRGFWGGLLREGGGDRE